MSGQIIQSTDVTRELLIQPTRAAILAYLQTLSATEINALIATAVANLVNSAPGTLDQLNELATALGNDPNFSTTVISSLAGKQPLNNNLSEIAALSTNPFGRSLLTLLNQAALQTAHGVDEAKSVNQPFTETITWTATTAPSNPTELRFSWYRLHKMVHFHIKLEYATPGSGVTSALFPIPASFPTPAMLSGTSTGKHMGFNAQFATNASVATTPGNVTCRLEYNGTNWQLRTTAGGAGFGWFVFNGVYPCP